MIQFVSGHSRAPVAIESLFVQQFFIFVPCGATGDEEITFSTRSDPARSLFSPRPLTTLARLPTSLNRAMQRSIAVRCSGSYS